MKKLLLILLSLTLIAGTLTGCQEEKPIDRSSPVSEQSTSVKESQPGEPPVLTVCLDLAAGSQYSMKNELTDILTTMEGYKEEFKVEVDQVPGTGSDREAAMTRIRTEIVSGAGPDVFFCDCLRPGTKAFPREETGLFQYPKALMERNMFLPLDDLIAGAKQMDTDGMYQQILEAGKDSQGRQQLLPMGWTANAVAIDKGKYTPLTQLPVTWEEMLASSDPGLQQAVWSDTFGGSLGVLANYETEEPSFTLEELEAHLEGARLNLEQRQLMREAMPLIGMGRPNVSWTSTSQPDQYYIPQYNRSGGSTAYITAFAAVNVNTQQPELAFRLVETVLSEKNQQNAELYSWVSGMPMYRQLCRKDHPVRESYNIDETTYQKWRMSDWNHDQLDQLVEQLTAVDYFTPLNQELTTLYEEYVAEEDADKRKELTAARYMTLRMMLAES